MLMEFAHRSRHGFCCDFQAMKWLKELSPDTEIEVGTSVVTGSKFYATEYIDGDTKYTLMAFVGD